MKLDTILLDEVAAPEPTPTPEPVASSLPVVTSTVTIDFPSLNWAISEGETKELPSDVEAQTIIQRNGYITLIK